MLTPNTRKPFVETSKVWKLYSKPARAASPRPVEEKPRAKDPTARTDAQKAEEWTRECLIDWYDS